jgi:hypothetical protein
MVGKRLTPEVRARLPQQNVRVIRPGQAVTMDYSAQRLNVELDKADRVARLSCG